MLKGARVYMVFELLEKMGEVVHSNPSVQDLEEENFDQSFEVMFVSKSTAVEIQSKLLKVSEVASVEVKSFSIKDYYKEQAEHKAEQPVRNGQTSENKKDKKKIKQKKIHQSLKNMPHQKRFA